VIENPFAKLKPFKKGDNRYISRVNPEEVLRAAHDDLLGPLPPRARPLTGITKEAVAFEIADRPQMYRVILLGTMTGLRRSELDRLQWGHIDFARNTLMVQSTADGNVKGAGSTRQVDLPEDLTATLEAWKKRPPACT
jgi:integrase